MTNRNDLFPMSEKILGALMGIIISLLCYLILRLSGISIGSLAILFILAVWIVVFAISVWSTRTRDTDSQRKRINVGGVYKTLLSIAIFVAVILIISAYWPEPRDRSINNIFKIKSQSGSGNVEFGENSIKLTSNDNRGTEFVLNLIHPNVGWVTLSTDVSAPSEGSTLKVSIIDLNNSAWSVRFSPISISSEIYARYTVIYKLGDYSAWIEDSNKMLKKIEGGRTEYQNKTRKYDIEIKVNVLPNSYIELKDVGILNG